MTQYGIAGVEAVASPQHTAQADAAWSLSQSIPVDHAPSASPVPSAFGDIFGAGLHRLEADLQGQANAAAQLATGQTENLHQVMLKLEESRIAFQFALQVRNRLLESYQDVMRMQI